MPRSDAGTFVGRAAEIARLRRAFTAAAAGHGRFVLIVGEPGIGKTRLAEEIAAEADRDGACVLLGRCHEGEGAPAYWPWVGVLRRLATVVGPERWPSLRADGAVIGAIVPELAAGARIALDTEAARFRCFDAVTATLARAARERPLVIVIEDLHAADDDSLRLLTFAVRELADAPVLFVATARTVELRARVRDGERETLGRSAEYVELGGLCAADVGALVAGLLAVAPPTALVARLQDATAGNPFFVEALVHAKCGSGESSAESLARLDALPLPEGIRDAVHARLSALDEATRTLLPTAALIGRECSSAVLARVADVPLAVASAAFEQAERAGLVGAALDHDRRRFVHGLIVEALVADVPAMERAHRHRRIADALAALVAVGGATLDAVAAHYHAAIPAGAADEAVTFALAAAHHAARRLGYEDAVRQLRRALTALDARVVPDAARRVDLLVQLGDAERRIGDAEAAQETYRRAVALAAAADMPVARARAALGFGAGLGGFWDQSVGLVDLERVAIVRDALAALEPTPSGLRAMLLAHLSAALFWSASPERGDVVRALGRDAITMAAETADPAETLAVLTVAHWTTWGPDDPAGRLRAADDIVRRALALDQPEVVLRGRMYAAAHHLELGDAAAAEQEIARFAAHAAEWGLRRQLWFVEVYRGMCAHLAGRFAEADEAATVGLAVAGRAQPLGASFAFEAQRALVRREQGRAAETVEPLRKVVASAPGMPVWACALAVALAESGDRDGARRELDRLAVEDFAALPRNFLWLCAMAHVARTCVALDDRERAGVAYRLLAPYAGQVVVAQHAVLCEGAVDRYLGMLATTLERWDAAITHLERALELNRRIGARIFVAWTECDLATTLRRRRAAGDEARAAALLAAAAEGARTLGQVALLARIAALSGATPASRPAVAADVCAIRRAGAAWTLAHAGRTFSVEDRVGVGYLITLLRHPGQEVHALDLVAGDGPKRSAGDAGEMLDERARAGYRGRLAALAGELEEAQAFHDDGRVARAQTEIDALTDELTRAVGLGGRVRRAGSDADRARLNVTRAMRRAIAAIAAADAILGHDLARGIRTGLFCAYTPDPRHPIRWEL
jgi:tetratricopeptide (TPR) repeat protein